MAFHIAAALAILAQAAPHAAPTAPPPREWTRDFCAQVELQTVERNPAHPYNHYTYHSSLAAMAGVRPEDTRDAWAEKIRRYIDRNMPFLLCNQFNFNPRDGNILKLAVAKQSNRFIRDVLVTWKVDLNQIDKTDGKTVLDYIRDRRAPLDSQSSLARTLARHYADFRAAGARHSEELTGD